MPINPQDTSILTHNLTSLFDRLPTANPTQRALIADVCVCLTKCIEPSQELHSPVRFAKIIASPTTIFVGDMIFYKGIHIGTITYSQGLTELINCVGSALDIIDQVNDTTKFVTDQVKTYHTYELREIEIYY